MSARTRRKTRHLDIAAQVRRSPLLRYASLSFREACARGQLHARGHVPTPTEVLSGRRDLPAGG